VQPLLVPLSAALPPAPVPVLPEFVLQARMPELQEFVLQARMPELQAQLRVAALQPVEAPGTCARLQAMATTTTCQTCPTSLTRATRRPRPRPGFVAVLEVLIAEFVVLEALRPLPMAAPWPAMPVPLPEDAPPQEEFWPSMPPAPSQLWPAMPVPLPGDAPPQREF